MQEAYAALMAHQRETIALSQAAGLLGWDREVMMPAGAATQRGEWMAALEAALHRRRTDPRIGDWLAALEGGAHPPEAAANLRLIAREYARSTRVPADLAVEIARVTSLAQGRWAQARAADDFASFAPMLEQVLALKRQQAAALADGGDPYDALLEGYEPGMTGARLDAILGGLRPGLIALRERILGTGRALPRLRHRFDRERQLQLAGELAERFGYDRQRGRLDLAVHPFSSGSGNDVRITTRLNEANPFDCIYATIHETGHACYEQAIRAGYLLTPLGRGVSMGVHESQSRFYENQLGRARPFTGWLFRRMGEIFGDFGIADADLFHAVVNGLRQGHIRTEADEVQYNLHILMRLDLERALIAGTLEVADLEEAWNARFLADFGFAVDRPANGVLQDVHWALGLFGYFPTYSLGNIYAGGLHAALRAAVPELDRELARGETGAATAWLRENLQQFGGLYPPDRLIERAAGAPVSAAPLLAYLNDKFGRIYAL